MPYSPFETIANLPGGRDWPIRAGNGCSAVCPQFMMHPSIPGKSLISGLFRVKRNGPITDTLYQLSVQFWCRRRDSTSPAGEAPSRLSGSTGASFTPALFESLPALKKLPFGELFCGAEDGTRLRLRAKPLRGSQAPQEPHSLPLCSSPFRHSKSSPSGSCFVVPKTGLEPVRPKPGDFKSPASAIPPLRRKAYYSILCGGFQCVPRVIACTFVRCGGRRGG